MNKNIETRPSLNSLWQDLINAIRGSEADYTEIKLGRAIFPSRSSNDP
jgi:hypothetical protein